MEQNKNEKTHWHNLFSLYRSLVGPFQNFEKRSRHKRELERTIANLKEVIGNGYKGTISEAFSHTLIGAIPFLIVFYVILNVVHVKDGVKLYDVYDDLTYYLIDAILYPFEGLIYVLLGLVITLIFFVPFPCLIFLFPLMIVGSVIPNARRISQAKKLLKTCEEQLPQAEAAIQEAWKKIAPYVKKIPPNYRNSNALAFFSNSFFNFKVKNLQEAVNLYDQHLHQQQMEQSQWENQRESMKAIDALSGQIAYLQDQIDSQETVVNNYYYY